MGTEVISDSRDTTLTTFLFLFLHHSIHMEPLIEFLFHICSCVFDYIYFYMVQWASLVAQLVKNLPLTQETLLQFLSQEDPLEKGLDTHSSILAWRIPMHRGGWWASAWGYKESDTTEQLSTCGSIVDEADLSVNFLMCYFLYYFGALFVFFFFFFLKIHWSHSTFTLYFSFLYFASFTYLHFKKL